MLLETVLQKAQAKPAVTPLNVETIADYCQISEPLGSDIHLNIKTFKYRLIKRCFINHFAKSDLLAAKI